MSTATPFLPQTLVDYAQILSAIATAAAVIVSLYIALRVPKPDLRVSANIKLIIWPGQPDNRPEYVCINVINIGNVTAKITNIGWRFKGGWRRKTWKWGVQDLSVPTGIQNSPLGVKLGHGEEANYYLPLQGVNNWLDAIRRHGFFDEVATSREALDKLDIVCFTSVGRNFYSKPAKGLLDRVSNTPGRSLWMAQNISPRKSCAVFVQGRAQVCECWNFWTTAFFAAKSANLRRRFEQVDRTKLRNLSTVFSPVLQQPAESML
jgi:hypothetical protein